MTRNISILTCLKDGWQGLSHLFFPDLCVACGGELPGPADSFCYPCRLKMEPTYMYRDAENPFTDRFWGRLPLQSATALYYFSRKSPVQKALHALKYRNRPEIGFRLGRELGRHLRNAPHAAGIEVIVPVPLHPGKERQRGYNQSLWFARGLESVLSSSNINQRALMRLTNTGSQTRKRRMERYHNVSGSFALRNGAGLRDKHVLLVDDVMTTGATLETCGRLLLDIPVGALSLATIAFAVHQ